MGSGNGVAAYLELYLAQPDTKVLDLRPSDDFLRCHLCRSHNIPADELMQLLFELPPKGHPVTLLIPPTTTALDEEVQWSDWFPKHGWPVKGVITASEGLWVEAAALGLLELGRPPQRTLLFHPCPLLAQFIDHIESSQKHAGLKRTCIDIGV
jgi:hypothetical protein